MTTLQPVHVSATMPYGTVRSWDVTSSGAGIDWADSNPSSGVFNFTVLDKFLAVNPGMDVLFDLARTPQWASSLPSQSDTYGPGQCAPPTNLANWDAWLTAVATHVGTKIKYWEVWNEPQDTNFYCGSVSTMVTMAQHANSIIKGINPAAIIVSPAPTGTAGPTWMNSFLAAGGGAYVDVIGFHGYSYPDETVITTINNYKSAMSSNSVSLPMWDTEVSNAYAPTNVAFMAKLYALHWSMGVSRMIWYAYDGATIWGQLWDGTNLNSAATGYSQLYQWLVGATLTTPCTEDGSSTWTCLYSRPGGYQAKIMWNSSTTTTTTVSAPFVQTRDLTGAVTAASGSVSIGNSPILIETQPVLIKAVL